MKAECPWCGKVNDLHVQFNGGDAQPKPGDTSMCWSCKSFSTFTEDGLKKEVEVIKDNNGIGDSAGEFGNFAKEMFTATQESDFRSEGLSPYPKMTIRAKQWGGAFECNAEETEIYIDGKVVFPTVSVMHLFQALHALAASSLKFMTEMGEDTYNEISERIDVETKNDYREASFQVTMMLIALGMGTEGVTLESVIREMGLEMPDPEEDVEANN